MLLFRQFYFLIIFVCRKADKLRKLIALSRHEKKICKFFLNVDLMEKMTIILLDLSSTD